MILLQSQSSCEKHCPYHHSFVICLLSMRFLLILRNCDIFRSLTKGNRLFSIIIRWLLLLFFEINIWLAACVGGQAQELDIELELELDIEIKLDLTNESCSSLEFLTSSLKLFVGFDWAGVGFEHVIVIVKPSLDIHYSTWFDYSLGLVEVLHIFLFFFFPVFSQSMTKTF